MEFGKHQGEGVFSITKTFQEVGDYTVIAHVTARDMHNMPKKEFIVEAYEYFILKKVVIALVR